jgi:hypothetical protein
MLANCIITFIIGGAFVRAGQEYGRNGLAWGAIGLASFFIPSLAIPILISFILTLAGASRDIALGSFNLTGLLGFATGVGATVWTRGAGRARWLTIPRLIWKSIGCMISRMVKIFELFDSKSLSAFSAARGQSR